MEWDGGELPRIAKLNSEVIITRSRKSFWNHAEHHLESYGILWNHACRERIQRRADEWK